ncbi:MarR family transcriptional regulator [Thermococcus sp.]|uniref:helix-turn-helix transcriptional regulator n=1 Tax=Thermococcus sp. TaxID=35749 RepID=UPI002610D7E8|nr:MarR family transcriptional regulator [Thermococcus sp.]
MKKFLAVVISALLFVPLVSGQGRFKSIDIVVYSAGYVKVTEVFVPSNLTVMVEVPLLTSDVAGLIVTSQNDTPLPFEKNGSRIDVYLTENVTEIKVVYFTASLTSKQGDVWTLKFSSPIPVTIHFPRGAIIVDLSDVPLSITGNTITMPPGNQTVSYTLPLPTTSTTSTTSTSAKPQPSTQSTSPTTSSRTPERSNGYLYALLIVPLVGAVGAYYLRGRFRKPGRTLPVGREEYEKGLDAYNLNDDEKRALLYIYDSGGKAKQADVRKALGIPKTTAWRMFKRLEEKGLVRVYKRGKENWVELVF